MNPVRKVTLMLRRADFAPGSSGPHGLHLQTDAGGKFAMKDIDAGKYYFSVNRSGFVAANMTHAGPSVQALRSH